MIGKIIADRYEIEELIGSGGMATVYKAKFDQLKRDVAIKILHKNLSTDPEVLKSFNKEAQAAARLSDPNIVSVSDVGEDDGIYYMVMELVDGITLKQYIKENGPLDWREACGFMLQICHALSVAHAEHIVHRDIKPQNILITKDGMIKVTDFGIAKAAFTETITVGVGGAMGSVHYISPEQARGGYTDERSDIYSTGVLFYELVTGKVPYEGTSAVSVALMHIEKDIPLAKAANPSLPIELSDIIKKAMSKEQFARYQTAEDLMKDITALLEGNPLPVLSEENVEEDIEGTKKFKLNQYSAEDDLYEDEVEDDFIADDFDDDFEEETEEPVKPKKKKKEPKTPEQKKADRLATLLALITVIVLGIMCFVGYAVYNNMTDNEIVPYMYNMSIDSARSEIEKKGLVLGEIEYAPSDSVDKNNVISQKPEAMEKVKKGTVVTLVISSGKVGGNIEVPYLLNSTPQEAIELVLNANLTYEIKEENSETVAQGKITRQVPQAGTMLNEGDSITIYTSKGPQVKVELPDFSTYTREKAESTLKSLGLQLGEVSIAQSDKPKNTVINQTPAAGSTVSAGSFVSIVLSSGADGGSGVISQPSASQEPSSPSDAPTQAPSGTQIKKTISFTVPGDSGSVAVKVTANGEEVINGNYNAKEELKFEIPSNEKVVVKVYINDKQIKEQIFE